MLFIKIIIYICILGSSSVIGLLLSKKYSNRVLELKDFKNALNMFKTKIKFTYEPVPEIFYQIGNSINNNVGNVFLLASNYMKNNTAENAWNISIENNKDLNIVKEDVDVLKKLGKLLGKTNLQGQISEIDLTSNFLDMQIEKAEEERKKNEKLYKTLGMVMGFAIVIILI